MGEALDLAYLANLIACLREAGVTTFEGAGLKLSIGTPPVEPAVIERVAAKRPPTEGEVDARLFGPLGIKAGS